VTHRVIYANAANSDLREIASYFRTSAGDVVAEAVINEILEAAETLAVRPTRLRLRNELSSGLRGLSAGNHMIFYQVDGDVVRIVRILHGSGNITAKLFPRGPRNP
jgi:toxin ParE1/3/4